MKVLWVGDSPRISTGFGRCSKAACDALLAAGHEVIVLGISDYGDPFPASPYPIYPCVNPFEQSRDIFGVERLPRLIIKHQPDLIVLLNDPWNIRGYLEQLKARLDETVRVPPIVGWLAVDGKNQVGNELNELAHVITWTQFATDELVKGGYTGPSSIVPLGVDHGIFYPRDRDAIRAKILPPDVDPNSFLIGVVGRNQLRKRLDLTIRYFARYLNEYKHCIDNTPGAGPPILVMHVAPTGDSGIDTKSFCKYYGIENKVLIRTPRPGLGVTNDDLAEFYSALDVLVTTTQGEGWGLPVLEAMACGTPCIVPDWSALGSQGGWTRDAVVRIPCTSTAPTAPVNGPAHTIGGIPDCVSFMEELRAAHCSSLHRQAYRQRGLRLAAEFSWETTGRMLVQVLETILVNRVEVEAEAKSPGQGQTPSPVPIEGEGQRAVAATAAPGPPPAVCPSPSAPLALSTPLEVEVAPV